MRNRQKPLCSTPSRLPHRRHSGHISLLLLSAVLLGLCLSGCGFRDSDKTLSEWIEELENWKLPGLRGDDLPDNMLPDSEAEAMLQAEAEAAAFQEAQTAALLHARSTVLGEWSELSDSLPLFRPIVSWYGSLNLMEDGSYTSGTTSGTWELNEDGTQLILRGTRGKTIADIVQDGSYTKLSVPELHLNFLRSRQLDSYIDERFVFIDITMNNVGKYIGKPVNIGIITDEKDRPTKDSAWVVSSPVYDDGLVYYGRSEDFSIEFQNSSSAGRSISIPYDTLSLATGASLGRIMHARGTLVFIRQEFVSDNRMTDARTRTLTFTDGTTHTTSLTWYSDLADYADWRF